MYLKFLSTFISLLILPLSYLNPEKSFLFKPTGVSTNLWFSKHGVCFGPVCLAVPPSSTSFQFSILYGIKILIILETGESYGPLPLYIYI
ncbi:hypothetical protein E2C01_046207 [Portunus trituberculatus]|uniref:Uncharacterized protein n=1 Tax=Portunus trituberculatus TaxID=210409 RepID=A0A5B7G0C1_PORTR|nr:hypothetical protein [Portunus trituberculatus]